MSDEKISRRLESALKILKKTNDAKLRATKAVIPAESPGIDRKVTTHQTDSQHGTPTIE